MVGLPILLTDDAAAGRARAGEEFAIYGRLPSYRALLEAEGATSPGGIAVVGDEAAIAGTLKRVEEMGATDFQATPFGDEEEVARTVELLASRPV